MGNKIVPTDPRELMRLAKEGDADAFGKIYELYFTPVFRYIYLRVNNKQDAEDLAQVVFLKVYASISRFEEQGKSPLSYFFTVARNTIIDHWRKKKDVLFENQEEYTAQTDSRTENPDDVIQKNETENMLRRAIQELTEEQQSVIILKFINDFSNKEISTMLQKKEETIRQIQCRAIKTLRQHLKKYG